MKIFDWLLGKKDKKAGSDQAEVAPKPAPSEAKTPKSSAPASVYPAGSFEEFAHRASRSSATITIEASAITRLVDVLRDVLMETYPSLEAGEAFSHASGGLTLRCPNCGQFSEQVVSFLYLAGSDFMKGTRGVFGGPNVAALAQGRCPGCGGSTIIATFNPQKIKAQLAAAQAAMAAAEGMPKLIAVCPGTPFFGNLDVSPDENLVCCAAPDGAVVAYESGTDRQKWSLAVPSAESCLCKFVGPERLLVLSEKEKDQTFMQLVNTADGSVVTETPGPKAYYSGGDANPHTGLFIGRSSYDTLLTIQTAGDKLQFSTYQCGQIYSGPRIGPDGQCYVIVHYHLCRVEGDQKHSVMAGDHCICFQPPTTVYCGGGYADRSGESELHVADLQSGETFDIAWGNEPIDEIALAGNNRLLMANTLNEVYVGRYPNATVTLFSVAGRKKEWSLTISDLKPRPGVILASAPEEGWALIQTGTLLKLIALQDGSVTHVLPKLPQEFVSARWLVSRKLLYIARSPDRNKPGMLECYRI